MTSVTHEKRDVWQKLILTPKMRSWSARCAPAHLRIVELIYVPIFVEIGDVKFFLHEAVENWLAGELI